jgi:hypothetical protein
MGDTLGADHKWEEPFAGSDFRPIWRMKKGHTLLLVTARTRSTSCTEIWLVEKRPDMSPTVSRETFDDPPVCEQWLIAKKEQLEAEGWRKYERP